MQSARPAGDRLSRQPTLLNIQTLSHDYSLGKDRFDSVIQPVAQGQQRASALPFGDPRVLVLMHALCLFELLPEGFCNAYLRCKVTELLHLQPSSLVA